MGYANMDGEGRISDYRSRLDKTLTSPNLTNEEMVHTLVKNQILQTMDPQLGEYPDCAIERKSKEVFKFLSELRSASSNDSNSGWKIKQDTEELRVMYREGPEGTPFHTLLAEGYVDGPVDVCLCISSDADLYKRWWPQIAVPTFRVAESHRVQRVIDGEQIAIVRMKLSWPMSGREVVVHYFTFEYFQEDLVVVFLNSISDSDAIDRSTHGFTRDGIPDAEGVVRMDLYGGFALKKITADRSFFRTIANLDIKLDFVPPAFINFVARQLVGSGFKLYKKQVASAKGNVEVQKALKDPLYARVREALYKEDASLVSPVLESTDTNIEQRSEAEIQDNTSNEEKDHSEAPYKEDTSLVSPVLESTNTNLEQRSSEAAIQDNTPKEDNERDEVEAGDSKALNEIEEFESTYTNLEQQSSEAEIQDNTPKEDNERDEAEAGDSKALNEIVEFENTYTNLEQRSSEAAMQENTTKEDIERDGVEAGDSKALNEIEEFEEKGSELHDSLAEEMTVEVRADTMEISTSEVERGHEITEHVTCDVQKKAKVSISPEVQRALGTLEKAISIFREYNRSSNNVLPDLNNGDVMSSENDAATESISWEADEIKKRNQACVESSKLRSAEVVVQPARSSSDNHNSRKSNSSTRETNQSKIAPAASPDEDSMSPSEDLRLLLNQRNVAIDSDSMKEENLVNAEANGIKGRNIKKSRFCCLNFGS